MTSHQQKYVSWGGLGEALIRTVREIGNTSSTNNTTGNKLEKAH
jgi:hypothetical protein